MKKTRTQKITKIILEKEEIAVIRRQGKQVLAWCEGCAGETRMVTPGEAARITQVSPRTIYRWVEAGQVHFTETAEGLLLICLNSLEVAKAE